MHALLTRIPVASFLSLAALGCSSGDAIGTQPTDPGGAGGSAGTGADPGRAGTAGTAGTAGAHPGGVGGANGGTAGSGTTAGASGNSSGGCENPQTLGKIFTCAGFDVGDPIWSWVREEPAAWRMDGDKLQMQSLGGTLWGDTRNNNLNIALREPPDTDSFVVQVMVQTDPENSAEQAGLLWYVDDDNYVKLVKELVGDEHVVVFAVETDGVPRVVDQMSITGDQAELELEIMPDHVSASLRFNHGEPWMPLEGLDHDVDASALIGLFTHGANESDDRWATFSFFSVASR
jgi:regulation of enolase protein 1 (concanavalin A-like superfamily)